MDVSFTIPGPLVVLGLPVLAFWVLGVIADRISKAHRKVAYRIAHEVHHRQNVKRTK